MDNTAALTAITQKLTSDTGVLIASIPAGGTPPPSVQPAIDAATSALTALDGQVLAATPGASGGTAPVITGVAPASLVAGVSTPVTLTGTGFTGATAINGTPALSFDSVIVVSDTEITVNVTVAAPGAQQLSVTGPGGTSNAAPLQTT